VLQIPARKTAVHLPDLGYLRGRESLIERTKLGLDRARAEGTNLGRPVRKIPRRQVKELRDKKISLAAISRILDIPYSTLRRNYIDEKAT
jgi:DNA invertase Pin-like site-specific DNA recombinase